MENNYSRQCKTKVTIESLRHNRTLNVCFLNFDFNIGNLEFYGYVKNDGISKMKGISIYNFDTISYLSTSEKGFIHCVGLNGKILSQIILKERD